MRGSVRLWLAPGPGEAVVDILARLRSAGLRTILDIPSGNAPVRRQAQALGYTVLGADLVPRRRMNGVVADACAPLPFRTDSVDCVVSMEGIEHFENQTGFLRECARVLRPGGALILTTPNVLHLSARMVGLLTGARTTFHGGYANEVTTVRGRFGDRLHHGHAFLVDAVRLRYILRVTGLEIRSIAGVQPSPSSLLLAPLLPALWLATRFSLARARGRAQRRDRGVPSAQIERELRRIVLSPGLLFGKKLVLVAAKPAYGSAQADVTCSSHHAGAAESSVSMLL